MAITQETKTKKKYATQFEPEETRLRRAKNFKMKLLMDDGNVIVIGKSGTGYKIDTRGGHAHGCECPDWEKRQPAGGCYHMIAWAHWLFDEVVLETGEICEL